MGSGINFSHKKIFSSGLILLVLILFLVDQVFTQPKREVRAVWVTTNHQLDWPPKTFNPDIQKKALIEILDSLKSKNFNTIYFQVRSQGSVLYRSRYEPWSPYLTGEYGQEPSFDPLDYVIKEAHKRHIEVHAWLNMINVKSGDTPLPFTEPLHIALLRPDWVKKYRDGNTISYWLDPGFPEVREYLKNICVEITENYDVDGIHLDYIRYPGIDFDDSLSYEMYGKKKPLAEFRRENINSLITSIYDTLISIKPAIKVGSAPIGIYENLSEARGLEGKHSVFQDSREWLKRKKHDYVVPQIYWDTKSNPKFEVLVDDWTKYNFGRHIVIGIGAFNPSVEKEIEEQIETTRKYNSAGQSFFRYENIKSRRFNAYKYPANIPPMKWKDSIPPNPPYLLSGKNLDGKLGLIELVWGIPLPASDGDTAKYYNIYRSTNSTIDRENSAYILAMTQNYYYYDFIRRPAQLEYFYYVSSFDKMHNESITGTEIIRVELTNLKEILKNSYAVDKVAFKVEKQVGSLLIETKSAKNVFVVLYDSSGNKIKDLYSGKLKTGINLLEFEIPQLRLKEFTLKVFLPERIEKINFRL
ncbi:MAG: glycoside hydrolase family 10 protein [Ignavibacteria bacterium]